MPFAIADATTLTEAGYVGEDVENIILKLLQKCDYDVERAETRHRLHRRNRQDLAQVRQPLDHPRRLRRGRAAGAAEDPRGHGRQRAAAGRSQAPAAGIPQVDTSNILFICGGAFVGLEKIIERRSSARRMASRRRQEPRERPRAATCSGREPEDLIKFGMIPEFVGRLPVVATLEELDKAAMMQDPDQAENALTKQYRQLFEMDGVNLGLREDGLWASPERDRAQDRRPGLRTILENVLLEIMYDLPSLKNVKGGGG